MDMHVAISQELNSKLTKLNMHATIKVQFNIYEQIHALTSL